MRIAQTPRFFDVLTVRERLRVVPPISARIGIDFVQLGAPLPPIRNTATLDLPDTSPEEVQAEIQAVLHSSAFERSEKLQKFLSYICELTIRGEGGKINEYLIGSEVFLRGPGYSPSEDSVVRRQAHTLRQKLQEYYAGEGSTHSVRIELPVGRYVPTFRRIKEAVPPPPEVFVAPPLKALSPAWAIAPLVGIALLAGAYFLGARSAVPSPSIGQVTKEIWGPWIHSRRQTVLCFSSPMTAVIKHFEQVLPIDTIPKRFRAHPDQEDLFRQSFHVPPGGAFYFTPAINQTKLGEALAGVHLATLLTRLGISIRTTQSRFVSWDDLRGDDMILLGNNEANEWLDPLLGKAPFQLTPSKGDRQRAIVNATPRPGEAAEYIINYAAKDREGDQEFALISMLPGMAADQKLLLISGLNAQATQAAAEYLVTEASLIELLGRLRTERPQHAGPWHFQAVLKTEVHDKVPTKTWLVAVRVL